MMTPFDIRDEVTRLDRYRDGLRQGDRLGALYLERGINALRLKVLEEIGRGSPDPKTLAIEVLKL